MSWWNALTFIWIVCGIWQLWDASHEKNRNRQSREILAKLHGTSERTDFWDWIHISHRLHLFLELLHCNARKLRHKVRLLLLFGGIITHGRHRQLLPVFAFQKLVLHRQGRCRV